MSSTNKTPYFELPQFVGTDIPTWLGDFNGAMSDIDTALKTNADRADLASTQAGQAVQTANAANDAVSALQTSVTGIEGRVTACENTNSAQSTQISQNASDIDNLDGRVTSLEQSGAASDFECGVLNLGSYSGNDFNNTKVMTTDQYQFIDNLNEHLEKLLSIDVQIVDGNFTANATVPLIRNYQPTQGFRVTAIGLRRVQAGSSDNHVKFYNIQFGAIQSNGTRSVVAVNTADLRFTTPSGVTEGAGTIDGIQWNSNGIVNPTSFEISITARYSVH